MSRGGLGLALPQPIHMISHGSLLQTLMWVSAMLTPIMMTPYDMGVVGPSNPETIMKTTIEIDQQLLRQAQKTLGTDTIKGTVEASLRTVVQRGQLQKLADALGTIPLALTPTQLRAQRHKRTPHVSR